MTDNQVRWTPLAIVGASCRLPGSRNLDEFWDLVRSGGDATGELPNDVLDRELYYDPQPVKRGKSYSFMGGLIPQLPFDNRKCHLSDEEIAKSDVSHLTMCEVASEALSDANYDPFNLPQRNAGVYFGHTGGSAIAGEIMYAIGIEQTAQYLHDVEGLRDLPKSQREEIIGKIIDDTRRAYDFRTENSHVRLAPVAGCELIARAFGLNGPCLVVDAACASSLQALAIGARALVHKTIDMAIVGGASCCKGDSLVLFSAAQSVTAGKSRPFDEGANGLVTSEGYVTLIIKCLEDAIAAGDRIRGVIRGVGMSSDGKGKSLWAPLKDGQKLAIRRAYDDQLRPTDIQFMEAHATSTQVGDATELAVLAESFPAEQPSEQKIPLGSVKANIGHTLETAGLAGLLKTMLAMEHGIIPPCANLETPNTEIDWDKLPFYLPREASVWDRNGTATRKAAVNAFGIGGLNVHIVLEEFSAQLPADYYGPMTGKSSAEVAKEPIAVIGMGAILPGVRSIDEFWQLLKSGCDPKTEVTPDRWNAELCYDPSEARLYRSYGKLGGFCTDYTYDWRKHRVPPKQIAAANPLQFMLLDAADQALAQGGYLDQKIDQERVGVIVGTNFGGDFSDDLQMGLKLPDFRKRLSKLLAERNFQATRIEEICDQYEELLLSKKPALVDETGSFTSSTLASRITKTFNLKGGALAMDAGVGTGLAALSAAVDALRSGDCDMMICAAGQRNMDLQAFECASASGILAKGKPAPACDNDAQGYVLGEGCAVVLLKRLVDAKRDNDQVLGVIHDVGVGADWKTVGNSFQLATARALQGSRLASEAIRSVETIATLPGLEEAEARAVASVLATPGRGHPLSFSSIVPQFGFMGAAHSLAATIKACLAISHDELPVATRPPRDRVLPPGTTVDQAVSDLKKSGCSSIGIVAGGEGSSCYHAIVGHEPNSVKQLVIPQPSAPNVSTARVVRFGAATWDKLQHSVRISDSVELMNSDRRFLPSDAIRLAIVCENEAELAVILAELGSAAFPLSARQRNHWGDRGVFFGEPRPGNSTCAFIFPGHSSQYAGMFAAAISDLPSAALAQRQADAALKSLGFQSFGALAGKQATDMGRDLWKTQAGLLIGTWVSYGTITSLGLKPSIVLGHSFGEYMALVAAGAWSLTDAIRAARLRAEAIESVPGLDGVMAATGADHDTIREVLDSIDGVFVANYNSPQQTVISGHRQSTLQAIQQLKARRASAVLITVPAPFHSPILEPAAKILAQWLTELPIRRTEMPVVSTAGLGTMRDAKQIVDSLSRQLVTPVHFPKMLDELLDSRPALVVEVGPKQVLTRLCEANHPGSDVHFMASDNPKRKGALSLLDVVAQADCLGCLDHQAPEKLPVVRVQTSRNAPRIITFDATQRRRERLRSKSEQVAIPQSPEPRHRSHANGNGSGNGHRQKDLAPTGATDSVANTKQRQPEFASTETTEAIGERSDYRQESTGLMPPTKAPAVDVDELRQVLVDFVIDQTGYPDDMIEMEADLEADLGIDSIKKAQLFGEVGSQFSIAPRDDLSLDDFPTLQHVIDFLVSELNLTPQHASVSTDETLAASVSEPASLSQSRRDESRATHPEFLRVIEFLVHGNDGGQHYGRAFRNEIQQNVRYLASEAAGVRTASADWSAEFQEELTGIATAAHVNHEAIFAWNAVDWTRKLRFGFAESVEPCDANDGVAAAVQIRQTESGLKYLTLGHAGQLTIPFGINSARLAVSSVPVNDNPPGLDIALMIQRLHELLSRCSNVDAAQHMLQTMSLNSTWLIGLSDANSPAAKFVSVSGRGTVQTCEGKTSQQEFHNACAAGLSDLRIFDRQSKAVKVLPLDELLPRSTPQASSPILPLDQQSFQRHVMRMVPASVTPTRSLAIPLGEAVTIVGDGPVAREVHAQLLSAGCDVEFVSGLAWQTGFRDHINNRRPRHLILTTPTCTGLDSFQPSQTFTEILANCQHWIATLEQSGMLDHATLAAVTQMGGDFCFSSRGQGYAGGALTGLFKGIRREYTTLRVKVVDFAAYETPASAATSLLNELRSDCTQLEVGFRGKERFVVRTVLSQSDLASAPPEPGAVWVVTGGGRGVTAAVAREFGQAYGLRLHLLGTAPTPDLQAVWRGLDAQGLKDLRRRMALQAREQGKTPDQLWRPIEKAMELDRNLDYLKQAGVHAEYHPCDITERGSLASVLESIRQSDGPITGVIHGAGVEAACRFSRKRSEMVQATIASKCDGGSNLIALTRQDPLKYFVGFGSTSGRFGGLGQADYSLASDLLAKMVGRLAEERPGCKAICFHWPAWDEIGMAARPESRLALERGGLSFMSPREGVSHFAAELTSQGSDHEILILNDPGMLDTDGTMCRQEAPMDSERFRQTDAASASTATPKTAMPQPETPRLDNPHFAEMSAEAIDAASLVQALRPGPKPDQAIAAFVLDPATAPFLIHHSFRGKPILPGVVTMQAFAEAAQMLRPNDQFTGLSNVLLGRGLSVELDQALTAAIRMKDTVEGVYCELLAPFTNSRGMVVDPARVYASALVEFGSPSTIPTPPSRDPLFGWNQFHYPPTAPILHGPVLRTFKALAFQHGTGLALIEGRVPNELLGTQMLRGTALPSAELDGCMVACGFYVYAMVDQTINLPHSIQKYRFFRLPAALEECKLSFFYQGRSEFGHRFDFVLVGDTGEKLFKVIGYETVAIKE